MCVCVCVCVFFSSIQPGPLSQFFKKGELAHASHFLLGIRGSPGGSVRRGSLTRCSIQMGRQLNGHSVDLWSLVDFVQEHSGPQLFLQQHTEGIVLFFFFIAVIFDSSPRSADVRAS